MCDISLITDDNETPNETFKYLYIHLLLLKMNMGNINDKQSKLNIQKCSGCGRTLPMHADINFRSYCIECYYPLAFPSIFVIEVNAGEKKE